VRGDVGDACEYDWDPTELFAIIETLLLMLLENAEHDASLLLSLFDILILGAVLSASFNLKRVDKLRLTPGFDEVLKKLSTVSTGVGDGGLLILGALSIDEFGTEPPFVSEEDVDDVVAELRVLCDSS
jgi:hypothetical protein